MCSTMCFTTMLAGKKQQQPVSSTFHCLLHQVEYEKCKENVDTCSVKYIKHKEMKR